MNFKQAKQKKERGFSVNELIDELVEQRETFSELMVIAVEPTGEVSLSYSIDDDAKAIGILEVLKQDFIDGIMER